MELADLLNQVRVRLDDTVEPYLWSDTLLTSYIFEAEREAAERAHLLPFNTEDADLTIDPVNVAIGTREVELDEHVYHLTRCVWVTAEGRKTLVETSFEHMDRAYHPRWEDLENAVPEAYIPRPDSLILFKKPSAIGTLHMSGFRLPYRQRNYLEIPIRHRERLVDWVLYRAYSIADSDTKNKGATEVARAEFEASFGVRHSAQTQRKLYGSGPRTVRYAGY